MFEGSATFVAATHPSSSWQQDGSEGLEILGRIRALDDSQEDAGGSLLSEGLQSNGPFYGFGALLSHAIVTHNGQSRLGTALHNGSPRFMIQGFGELEMGQLKPPADLLEHIRWLDRMVRREAPSLVDATQCIGFIFRPPLIVAACIGGRED